MTWELLEEHLSLCALNWLEYCDEKNEIVDLKNWDRKKLLGKRASTIR